MSNSNYMPLNGALLISNPRKNLMASARNNAVRGVSNRIARMIADELKGAALNNPAHFTKVHPYDMGAIKARAVQLAAEWETVKHMPVDSRPAKWRRKPPMRGIVYGDLPKSSPQEKAILSAAHRAAASALKASLKGGRGMIQRQFTGAKGRRYLNSRKRVVKPRVGPIASHYGRTKGGSDQGARAAYAARRAGFRAGDDYYSAKSRSYDYAGKSRKGQPKASREVLNLISQPGYTGSDFESFPKSYDAGIKQGFRSRRKKGGKGSGKPLTAAQKGKMAAGAARYRAAYKQFRAEGMSHKEANLAWKATAQSNPVGPRSSSRYYRRKHHLAQQNYGALALDNYGALALDNYGALALDNPVPFVGGVAADTGKLVLTGLAGVVGHAVISSKAEELIEKIPVAGEWVLDLSVPDALPWIGGMGLTNTVVGALSGLSLILVSQMAGRKLGMPEISRYGSALGTGVILIGPALDYAAGPSVGDGLEDDALEAELSGLALENYGGLALENDGTFGDGMAYQLGAIASDDVDDYGQCSLGDAYYSGADFDLGEGQALLNGKGAFRKRYGHPSRRVHHMGGTKGGASHLAGRQGHRWGWLIKMIGWQNTQKLAALPPAQRVGVLKQLRANALSTFKKSQVEADEVILSAPELAPDGVSGAFGATMFGGKGL